MESIGIIVSSVRAGRICPQIAEWVLSLATGAKLEILDLAAWSLPMDDEPGLPADGVYQQEHTKAWSRKIAALSGYVIVTPQYNWGYPASLKNALDHLFHEWSDKPALLITYGFHGGEKCAAQLQPVLTRFGMKLLESQRQLIFPKEMYKPDGLLRDPAELFSSHSKELESALADLAKRVAKSASSTNDLKGV